MGKASRKKHQQRYQKNVLEKYGNVKLADAITHLCEPYEQSVGSDEKGYRNLIAMTVLAWNIALVPDAITRETKITEMINYFISQSSMSFSNAYQLAAETAQLQSGLYSMVSDLISRKDLYYPNDDRVIVDYTLGVKSARYHLQVKSIIPQRNAE